MRIILRLKEKNQKKTNYHHAWSQLDLSHVEGVCGEVTTLKGKYGEKF